LWCNQCIKKHIIFVHQNLKQKIMQELINRLTAKAGITTEQAAKSLETIKEFVKEKFPMLGGATPENVAAAAAPKAEEKKEESMMDKISDVIPGQAGEKVEEFAKNAAHKAEEVFDNVKDKLSGMFGGDKK
jgi:CO dehydrogenase/acetyl-CoA synthase beta subunit